MNMLAFILCILGCASEEKIEVESIPHREKNAHTSPIPDAVTPDATPIAEEIKNDFPTFVRGLEPALHYANFTIQGLEEPPKIPPLSYSKPVFRDRRLQNKIDSLCRSKKANTAVVPMETMLSTATAIDGADGLLDGQIILTFDDGPTSPYDTILLDILRKCDIKAHFFLVGRQLVRDVNQAIIKQMVRDGHLLGSHSHNHKNLNILPPKTMKKEIQQAHANLERRIGRTTKFFRLPFGSGRKNAQIHRVLRQQGLVNLHWSLSTKDTVHVTSSEIIETALRSIRYKGKGIFVFHPRQRYTIYAVTEIIETLVKEGYQFVTIQDLERKPNLAEKATGLTSTSGVNPSLK